MDKYKGPFAIGAVGMTGYPVLMDADGKRVSLEDTVRLLNRSLLDGVPEGYWLASIERTTAGEYGTSDYRIVYQAGLISIVANRPSLVGTGPTPEAAVQAAAGKVTK